MEDRWYNIFALIMGGAVGGGTIVMFLLRWLRFKPKDSAEVEELKARTEALSIESDLKLAREVMEYVTLLKTEINRKNEALDRIEAELIAEHERCEQSIRRNDELQKMLHEEKMRSRRMEAEIEQLRLEIQNHKNK